MYGQMQVLDHSENHDIIKALVDSGGNINARDHKVRHR